jgi:hypothetical protein
MVLLSVIIVFGLSACMSPSDLEINEIPDTTLSMITLESNANIGLVVRANGQVDSVIDFNDEGKSALEGVNLTYRSLEEVLDLPTTKYFSSSESIIFFRIRVSKPFISKHTVKSITLIIILYLLPLRGMDLGKIENDLIFFYYHPTKLKYLIKSPLKFKLRGIF